jgi:hypothetical protein
MCKSLRLFASRFQINDLYAAGQTRDNCGKQVTTDEILKLVLTKLLTNDRATISLLGRKKIIDARQTKTRRKPT